MTEQTTFRTLFEDLEETMTGNEMYPIVGKQLENIIPLILGQKIKQVMESLAGMNRYWDCIEKAFTACKVFGGGQVVVGSLLIDSADGQSTYGFLFNPPLEIHAWVQGPKGIIIDCALPGIIEKGMKCNDHIGPYLVGREPCILFGRPLEWMHYDAMEQLT